MNDDYKVTNNLTLNLGLRYDVLTGWTDRYNKLTWFDPTTPDPVTNLPGIVQFAGVNGNPRAENDTTYTNFAPRLGFAYKLGDKTAIRAGYGLFWVTNSDGNVAGTGYQVSTNVYTGRTGSGSKYAAGWREPLESICRWISPLSCSGQLAGWAGHWCTVPSWHTAEPPGLEPEHSAFDHRQYSTLLPPMPDHAASISGITWIEIPRRLRI